MAAWEYDKACFFLKRTPVTRAIPETDKVMIDSEDDDIVRYVDISEHLGHIPAFCYRLKVDPTLRQLCPQRPTRTTVVPAS